MFLGIALIIGSICFGLLAFAAAAHHPTGGDGGTKTAFAFAVVGVVLGIIVTIAGISTGH